MTATIHYLTVEWFCSSIWAKARGLMFARKPLTLVMPFAAPRRIALHMFFVRFPIDVIFLDAKNKIIEIKEQFRPWTQYRSHKPASFVVECSAGTVKKNDYHVGDIVLFGKQQEN